jgi:hypothetical protein
MIDMTILEERLQKRTSVAPELLTCRTHFSCSLSLEAKAATFCASEW